MEHSKIVDTLHLEDIVHEFIEWSRPTFKKATALSSLRKLEEEIKEVEWAIWPGGGFGHNKQEEYADCLMCLFDSAARAGVTLDDIKAAMANKLKQNKLRTWILNDDNTYSHLK